MVHLVYCDNTGKKGEKEFDKIIYGRKNEYKKRENNFSFFCTFF